jgi:hypothetical protein
MEETDTTAEVFAALDRLIAATSGFVTAWGDPDPALLRRLEEFAGGPLPADFQAFSLRYGNAYVGYLPVRALGPVAGLPAAQALTEERRAEWPAFPPECLALGEYNTDLIVLRRDGAVQFRTESSRDLAVFESFPSFTAFLRHAVDWAVDCAKGLERLPPSFNAWQAIDEQSAVADGPLD